MDASEAARELETSRAVSDIDVSETDMSSDEEEEDDPISLASKVRVHFQLVARRFSLANLDVFEGNSDENEAIPAPIQTSTPRKRPR